MNADTIVRGFAVLGLAGAFALAAAPARAHEDDGNPAKLHTGTCADLGPVAASLTGVGAAVGLDGTPVAAAETVGADAVPQVGRSDTGIDLALDDILAGPYAVMVYQSDEDLSGIACGNVVGARLGDELAIGLDKIGEPGLAGLALFRGAGAGTGVTVFLPTAESPAGAGSSGEDAGDGHDDAPAAASPAAAT